MHWSYRQGKPFRLALGSFIEEYNNKVEIVELDFEKQAFVRRARFDHPYPTTKIVSVQGREIEGEREGKERGKR